MGEKRIFGKGIYSSKDVPIKMINALIAGAVAIIAILIVVFALTGGFTISFDTDGGSHVNNQVCRHGKLLDEPETPVKEGYKFICWTTSPDGDISEKWNFDSDKVEESMTLYAVWEEK